MKKTKTSRCTDRSGNDSGGSSRCGSIRRRQRCRYPSKYLQDQKGTLTMTVSGDRDVRVKIEKDTLDGVITYYDTTLENDGTYDFTLDSCEYNVNTETYDSSFTVSVWDKADSSCSYTEEHLVVMDPGFTQNVETEPV